MAIVKNVMRFLLLSFIKTGANGEKCLICADDGYDITFPRGEDVCFHVWHFSTNVESHYIAIVSNGKIQMSQLLDDDSQSTLPIKHLTDEDVGHHRCMQRPDFFYPRDVAPVLNLQPGKAMSLQCVCLTCEIQGHCYSHLNQEISLTWVDETDAEVQEDSQHQIEQQSSCDITLTVTLQRPQTRSFRCQVTVGYQVQTSVAVMLRLRAPKGRRGGHIVEPEIQGSNQDAIGATVGVVGCVALTTFLIAAFVVNRRRTSNQLPDEPLNTTRTNNAQREDDVIYADIVLPDCSDTEWVQESEPTEYACIKYQ